MPAPPINSKGLAPASNLPLSLTPWLQPLSYLQHLIAQSKLHPVCWPDLVVLDIEMPGTNGFAVLKYIRSQPEFQALPVVVLSKPLPTNQSGPSLPLGPLGVPPTLPF